MPIGVRAVFVCLYLSASAVFVCRRPRTMEPCSSAAPEDLGELKESSSEEVWRAAARHTAQFVLTVDARQGRGSSHHLMQREPPPKRAFPNGITGYARELEAHPPALAFGSSSTTRVHVCKHRPCRADHHPSKYGNLPCVQEHGRISGWGRGCFERQAAAAVAQAEAAASAVQAEAAASATQAVDKATADGITGTQDPAGAPALALACAALQTQILRRAGEVRKGGRYIGLWEFLCWCFWRKTKCNMLFSDGAIDIVDAFAPQIARPTPGQGEFLPMSWSRAHAPRAAPTSAIGSLVATRG